LGIVFQYGSNTCAARLNSPSRLSSDAKPIDKAQTVDDYEIFFNVLSLKNQCAASNICLREGSKVWGVLYDIPDELIRGKPKGRKSLEQIEGQKYNEQPILVVKPNGDRVPAVTFAADKANCQESLSTSVWYLSWILYGLREHKVDEDYIEHVRQRAIDTNGQAKVNTQNQIELIKTL